MNRMFFLSCFIFITANLITGCNNANNKYNGLDTNYIRHFTKGEVIIKDLDAEARQIIPVIKNITGKNYSNIADILTDAKNFDKADIYASESDDDVPDSTKLLLEQLKTIVINKQVKVFPLMRKAYCNSISKAFLKQGVITEYKGNKIVLNAAVNISDTIVDSLYKQIVPELELLRFVYPDFKLDITFLESHFQYYYKRDEDIDYYSYLY